MSKPKLTPWFPPEVKPVHVGWYHTDDCGMGIRFESGCNWWWDGEFWLTSRNGQAMMEQKRTWRGLAEKPEGV